MPADLPDSTPPEDLERALARLDLDSAENKDALFAAIYAELRSLARGALAGRGDAAGHTLQPTAVVHEVYLKLAKADGLEITTKEHFLALAARAMRQILLNHARDKRAQKRGGDQVRVTLHDGDMAERDTDYDVIELEDALAELEAVDRVQARIVELHFFGGLTFVEIAALLSMSESTVRREWRMARAELLLLLGGDDRQNDGRA